MQDYSKQAMLSFLEYVANKHLINQSAAKNWKSASVQFLDILDESEALDLRSLDIEHLGQRYGHSKGNQVKPDSLRIYLTRFKSAHENFLSYADNKVSYRPLFGKQKPRTTANTNGKVKESSSSNNKKLSLPSKAELPVDVPLNKSTLGSINFPIPISDGKVVIINNLPCELKKADADKISAVIQALAFIEQQK